MARLDARRFSPVPGRRLRRVWPGSPDVWVRLAGGPALRHVRGAVRARPRLCRNARGGGRGEVFRPKRDPFLPPEMTNAIPTRRLGRTELELPILSFGASSLGAEFRNVTVDDALSSVHVAL